MKSRNSRRLFWSEKTMLWSVIGSIVACVPVPTNGFAIDKIATNAKAVFTKAGGTTNDGLTQKQFQAAEPKISDAMDQIAHNRIIGGAHRAAVRHKAQSFQERKDHVQGVFGLFSRDRFRTGFEDSPLWSSGRGRERRGASGCGHRDSCGPASGGRCRAPQREAQAERGRTAMIQSKPAWIASEN